MKKQEAIEEIKQADERLWQFAKPLGGTNRCTKYQKKIFNF